MSEEKTITEIVDEIIDASDGAFSIAVTEAYEALEYVKQLEVDDLVGEEIQPCGSCGWHWHVGSMEESLEWEEDVCYKCADTERMEAEDEDE